MNCRKCAALFGVAVGFLLLSVSAAADFSDADHTRSKKSTPEPLLHAIAHRIAPPVLKHQGFWEWINDREVLVVHGQKGASERLQVTRRDLFTGKEVRLSFASRDYYWWNHDHLTISPDGRWAVWRTNGADDDGTLVLCPLTPGKGQEHSWKEHGDEHDAIVFLPDSHHWVTFLQKRADGITHTAEVFDLRSPGKRRILKLPASFPSAEFVANNGLLVDVNEDLPATYGQSATTDTHSADPLLSDGVRSVNVITARLLPVPRLLDQVALALPLGQYLDSYAVSPTHGDYIAWVCIRPGHNANGDGRRSSIWISDRRGLHWQETGAVPRTDLSGFNRPGHLRWSQDERHLRFEQSDGIYEIDVSNNLMKLSQARISVTTRPYTSVRR